MGAESNNEYTAKRNNLLTLGEINGLDATALEALKEAMDMAYEMGFEEGYESGREAESGSRDRQRGSQ